MLDEINARLASTLPAPEPAELASYDGELNIPLEMLPFPVAELRPAAVLIPIVARDEPCVLFTQRTNTLRAHAGQISFPGGGAEADDRDAVATALRETEEEVGISANYIEIAGYLDPHISVSGFCVTPVVGVVQPGFEIRADPTEVADVFEVPLAHVLNPENHQCRSGRYRDREVHYFVIQYQSRMIWGLTANMLVNLYRKLHA